jgi:hypothetical protein
MVALLDLDVHGEPESVAFIRSNRRKDGGRS